MPSIEPSRIAGRGHAALIVGPVAAAAIFVACGEGFDLRRTKVRVDRVAQVVGGMQTTMPLNPLSLPAGSVNTPSSTNHSPAGATPTWVSAAVAVSRLHQVVTARIGGLYGP